MSVTKPATVIGMARERWEDFLAGRTQAMKLDAWATGNQYDLDDDPTEITYGQPYSPRERTTTEYNQLNQISVNPFAGLVVKSLTQTAYVDGFVIPKVSGDLAIWDNWQRNRMDRKQVPLHKGAVAHGASYSIVMPGQDPLTGEAMPTIAVRSAIRMAAYYNEDDDEFPALAIDGRPYQNADGTSGWYVDVYDETAKHSLSVDGRGLEEGNWTYISYTEHPLKVTPVVMFANSLDLDGRATGEIEGIIPILRRIDQTTFDRLIVQRFGAWKVRYIAGMAKPDTEESAALQALKLRVTDLLVSPDKETKFGTLDASDVAGFISSGDTDLRYLSAITQTPPHHLLGLSSNLQAEALAAAESGLQRKSVDFKISVGESHETQSRLVALLLGNQEESSYKTQTRWRDTESRSFMQTVQGLSMAATGLKIPIEMLWEKFPGWTDIDVQRAKENVENGELDKLLTALAEANGASATLEAEQQGQPQQEKDSADSGGE